MLVLLNNKSGFYFLTSQILFLLGLKMESLILNHGPEFSLVLYFISICI
jgi:hypothetical protein